VREQIRPRGRQRQPCGRGYALQGFQAAPHIRQRPLRIGGLGGRQRGVAVFVAVAVANAPVPIAVGCASDGRFLGVARPEVGYCRQERPCARGGGLPDSLPLRP
jgi:hypothetical protein